MNYVRQFFLESGQFSTRFISETKSMIPNLFCTSDKTNHLTAEKIKKISWSTGKFSRERP